MVTTRQRSLSKCIKDSAGRKRKKIDELRGVGESEDDIEVIDVESDEEEDRAEQYRRIMNRPVASERPIDIANLGQTNLPEILKSRGWLSICKVKVKPCVGIVREFYANIVKGTKDGDAAIISFVRGKEVEISPSVISRVLNISRESSSTLDQLQPGYIPSLNEVAQELCDDVCAMWDDRNNVIEHARMSVNYRLLNMVFNANIHPRLHATTLTPERAKMLYAIGKDHYVDLPLYMFKVIQSAYRSKSRTDILPFGSYISRILKRYGVRASDMDEVAKLGVPINGGTLNKSNAHSRKKLAADRGKGMRTDAHTQNEDVRETGASKSINGDAGLEEQILKEMHTLANRITSLGELVRNEVGSLTNQLDKFEDYLFAD